MTDTPLLRSWFDILDGTEPDRVLGMITEDFQLSIFFATSEGSAEFSGDREALVGYLAQREKSTLVHHILQGAHVGDSELVLGETRRRGEFEASFNASALLDESGERIRRLLICRTPKLRFTD
ncbi:hypothetical protein KUV85_14730 [Nocardioides panacisoli]|uniref:hypothetical protein n=1 Tax=Nocardioides panacisoli TaxID=627624 RepID=UPI001C63075E|nr:hypothetical protein [Nocardioides panacisoli]QYJ03570.1 hypothetical protein KUV85_14730 [Nocardioides panacisoli]